MEVFKLNNGIDITIEDDLPTKNLFSDLGIDDKNKCEDLGQIFTADNEHERLPPLMTIINNPDNSEIEKFYDPCIESKYTKIVRYKKMTPTTKKLQKIHANLWRSHDPFLLSRKSYLSLFLDPTFEE